VSTVARSGWQQISSAWADAWAQMVAWAASRCCSVTPAPGGIVLQEIPALP
jgi:hypothetical protein